jgi:hypothetical protein
VSVFINPHRHDSLLLMFYRIFVYRDAVHTLNNPNRPILKPSRTWSLPILSPRHCRRLSSLCRLKMSEESARMIPNGEPNGAVHSISSHETSKTVNDGRKKLHGRAFYESLGSPKVILAPMVDQSEFVRHFRVAGEKIQI